MQTSNVPLRTGIECLTGTILEISTGDGLVMKLTFHKVRSQWVEHQDEQTVGFA